MAHYEIPNLTQDEHAALVDAVVLGCFAERQKTLRALIESNKGTQTADLYERNLGALERVAHALTHASYIP